MIFASGMTFLINVSKLIYICGSRSISLAKLTTWRISVSKVASSSSFISSFCSAPFESMIYSWPASLFSSFASSFWAGFSCSGLLSSLASSFCSSYFSACTWSCCSDFFSSLASSFWGAAPYFDFILVSSGRIEMIYMNFFIPNSSIIFAKNSKITFSWYVFWLWSTSDLEKLSVKLPIVHWISHSCISTSKSVLKCLKRDMYMLML